MLGLLLGLGMAFIHFRPSAPPQTTSYVVTQPFEAQRLAEKISQQTQQSPEIVLVSLLIGVLFAAPFFLVARTRSRKVSNEAK